jgi:hypothetical protein
MATNCSRLRPKIGDCRLNGGGRASMSSEMGAEAHAVHDSERLIRIVSFVGFALLPVLVLFVHLLLIYRA